MWSNGGDTEFKREGGRDGEKERGRRVKVQKRKPKGQNRRCDRMCDKVERERVGEKEREWERKRE